MASEPSDHSRSRLSMLLDDEYFLLNVLECVLEDGIHECRLVCRRWREVCSKLPVKIREMHMNEMPRVLGAFPNVASLRFFDAAKTPDVLETHLMPYLPQLRALRHLQLPLYRSCQVPEGLASSFQSMDHLRSLSLKIDAEGSFAAVMEILKLLAQLTALTIHVFHGIDVDPAPVTELQRLRELSGNANVLVNKSGELLFPSLTQLTKLAIARGGASFQVDKIPKLQVLYLSKATSLTSCVFQVICPYASSLRSLDLGVLSQHPQLKDWSVLRSFSALETLKVADVDERSSNFSLVLGEMHHLTQLVIAGVTCESVEAFMETVFSLVGLKALTLKETWKSKFPLEMTESLTAMTQLTRLCLVGRISGTSLRHLTNMVDLEIRSYADVPVNLPNVLACMSNLESLQIVNSGEEVQLPSAPFEQLKRLKTLKLWKLNAEKDFLKALGALPDLTELRFSPCGPQSESDGFYAHLSRLSNLRVLEIPCSRPFAAPRLAQFEGRLPRLREVLFSSGQRLSNHEKTALMQAFPGLRRI